MLLVLSQLGLGQIEVFAHPRVTARSQQRVTVDTIDRRQIHLLPFPRTSALQAHCYGVSENKVRKKMIVSCTLKVHNGRMD